MKAVFTVPPGMDLPSMKVEDSGLQFHYRDAEGNLAGGYCQTGLAPDDSGMTYEFDASPESIMAWKAAGKYVWVADI